MRVGPLVLDGVVAWTGCSEGSDEDTLQPLPIEGATVAAPSTSAAVVIPPSATTTSSIAVTTTAAATPIGDWDGARFDAGTEVTPDSLRAAGLAT